ncbi:class I SAM-dependent methyltransferase [Tabrizicola sp.]|uniref:class I SAM-dependent methyltransferase n=1 Tax=Tabrizicola sp. TaxID=2005166 RepID=UPI001A3D7261|nr:class I SAM-dependent methyltransferase [Tabrizicola sp.]MBL9074777.1 class I SAM-dependent methyltransferase [Tabrizicola sp.]
MTSATAIAGYTTHAPQLVARYDAIPNEIWYAPVRHLLPTNPARVIDVGAGTGRDARWLAAMGHKVTAVEPVPAFVAAGQAQGGARWITDALPDLPHALALDERFDLILLSAVWQHLDAGERQAAAPVLRRLAATGATLLMALRHGPASTDRPVWPIDVDATAQLLAQAGFRETFRASAPSIQPANLAAGVRWTWLALAAQPEAPG